MYIGGDHHMKHQPNSFVKVMIPFLLFVSILLSATTTSSCIMMQSVMNRLSSETDVTDIITENDPLETKHLAETQDPDDSGEEEGTDSAILMEIDFAMFSDYVTSDTLSLHLTVDNPDSIGLTEPDVKMWNVSKEETDAYYDNCRDYLEQLDTINYDNLTDDEKIIYDVIAYDLEEAILFEDYYYYSSPFNSLTGIQSNLPLIMSEYTFENKQDIDDYIVLLNDTYRLFEEMMVFEAERAAEGLGASDANLEKIIESCTVFMEDQEDHFLVTSFADRIAKVDDLTESEKQDYIQQNQAALDESIFPAYQILIDGFTDLLGTGVNEGGLCNFENGETYYEILLKRESSSDFTINQAVNELDTAIDDSLDVIYDTTYDDVFEEAYSTYDFSAGTIQENLDFCSSLIQTDFPAIADHEVTLKEVPSQLEDFFSPAAYLTCKIDDPTDNIILTNPASLDGYQNLLEIIAHEGYPGHMYEAIYHSEHIDSYYQRSASFIAYSEGWAEYSSAYVLSQTEYDQTLVDYVTAESNIFNLFFPARIDIGVNYEGWDLQDVNDYLLEYNLDYPEYAEICYDRAIEIPCYIMKYAYGQIQTFEIISDVAQRVDDTVTLLDIHTAYLDIGPAPFPIIEENMQKFMDNP
jgi:uncharacterized protein (DUF885 family)